MKKRRVRIRKPRDDWFSGLKYSLDDSAVYLQNTMPSIMDAEQCRRLAAWLLKSADWLDAKKEGQK